MRIIISGCGKIGKSILRELLKEDHHIIVIDKDPSVISSISDRYDVMTVCGSATSFSVLEEASIFHTDLFIAMTNSDEVNLVGCQMARKLGARHTIARVSNMDKSFKSYSFLKNDLNISFTFDPDALASRAIYNMIKFRAGARLLNLTRHRFTIVGITLQNDSLIKGMSLRELFDRFHVPFLVCFVIRDQQEMIPRGDFVLRAGDEIGVLATPQNMLKIMKYLGIYDHSAREVVIIGSNKAAVYLTKDLIKTGSSVTIIERDEQICRELCSQLPSKVNVLCDDRTNRSIITENVLARADAFVALTEHDEENILNTYFALEKKIPRVITKVNQESFLKLSKKMGLDGLVSPRHISAEVILQYVHALKKTSDDNIGIAYTIPNTTIQASELIIPDNFPQKNLRISELKLRPNTLIGGIVRQNHAIIAAGNECLYSGDHVIIFTIDQIPHDIIDILL